MILTYIAAEKDSGRTVHSIVRREFRVSTALLRRLKASLAISVSGDPVFTDYVLAPGEVVTVDIAAAEHPCDNIPEQGSLEVLFENEGLIAVNKPTGMLVHPSRSRYSGTLANFVAGYLGAVQGAHPRSAACHAVNRLDRDTSGVVLFAKNSYMKALASQALSYCAALPSDAALSSNTALQDKAPIREYLALVYGVMPGSGTIDAPIRRLEERNMLRVVSEDGQRAVTHFETIKVIEAGDERLSLVLLNLETGRTHQIRVHCRHIGHPVLGDMLYNTEGSRILSKTLDVTTQALHAHRLAFIDPISGQRIEIIAPIKPENFPCISPQDMLTLSGASPPPLQSATTWPSSSVG